MMTTDLMTGVDRERKARSDAGAKARRALWTEYRNILGRAERPRATDAKKLLDLAGQLGVVDERLIALHRVAVSECSRLGDSVDRSPALLSDKQTAEKKFGDLQEEAVALQAKIVSAYHAAESAGAAFMRCRDDEAALDLLVTDFPWLLDEYDSEPDPLFVPRDRHIVSDAIARVLNETQLLNRKPECHHDGSG